MILTVCMNPWVDVTIELDSLNVGKMNIVKNKSLSFAGKALNVAIGVARLGGMSVPLFTVFTVCTRLCRRRERGALPDFPWEEDI